MEGPATIREGLLVAACSLLRPRIAVEVGVGGGRHTVLFAAALPPGGLLYGIDVNLEPAVPTIEASPHRRSIVLLEGRSHDRIPELPDGIGFAYVDGDHSYEAVLGDARLLWPKMAPNGIMAFDDVNNEWVEDVGGVRYEYGVRRALERFMSDLVGAFWQPRHVYFPWGPGVVLLQKPGPERVNRTLAEAQDLLRM